MAQESTPDVSLELPAMTVAARHDDAISLEIPAGDLSLRAVYAAGQVFLDRCFVCIERPTGERLRVTLAARQPVDDPAVWEGVAAEFENELHGQAFRARVEDGNRELMDLVMAHALSSAGAPPEADSPDDDALDDPLGIAQSWEQRYGRPPASPPEDTET